MVTARHQTKLGELKRRSYVGRERSYGVNKYTPPAFPVGQGLIILLSRSHTTTHHTRWDSSGRGISPTQRPLPAQHTSLTKYKHPFPRRHSNPQSRQAMAEDPRLISRGHSDRMVMKYLHVRFRLSYGMGVSFWKVQLLCGKTCCKSLALLCVGIGEY